MVPKLTFTKKANRKEKGESKKKKNVMGKRKQRMAGSY